MNHFSGDECRGRCETLINMNVSKSLSLWLSFIIWKIYSAEEESDFSKNGKVYLKLLTLVSSTF